MPIVTSPYSNFHQNSNGGRQFHGFYLFATMMLPDLSQHTHTHTHIHTKYIHLALEAGKNNLITANYKQQKPSCLNRKLDRVSMNQASFNVCVV